MENLIKAWGNYYFQTGENIDTDRFFTIEETWLDWTVSENIIDDISEYRMSGSLEDCVKYCESLGAYNYDPLAKWR